MSQVANFTIKSREWWSDTIARYNINGWYIPWSRWTTQWHGDPTVMDRAWMERKSYQGCWFNGEMMAMEAD